jgi:hypothetical protein
MPTGDAQADELNNHGDRMTKPLAAEPHIQVSTPSLAFLPRLVEAEEPVGIQALGAELAVQALDEPENAPGAGCSNPVCSGAATGVAENTIGLTLHEGLLFPILARKQIRPNSVTPDRMHE